MLSVRRSTLDHLLVSDAIERGACYLSETKGMVEPLEIQDSSVQQELLPTHRTVHLQSRSSSFRDTVAVRSRMVVVATGLSRSALPRGEVWPATQMESSRIGVHTLVPSSAMKIEKELETKAKRREPTLHMLIGTIGYLGVCKTDGDQWDFAAAIDPDQVRRFGSIAACVRSILKENGLTNTAFLEQSSWQSTPHLTRTSDCVAMNGVFLLGDAMGYVEPFTGEGMSWAFAGAAALHQITCKAINSIDHSTAEQAWNRWVMTAHRSRQKSSRWVANQSRDLARARFVLRACDWLPPLKHLLLRKIMT
jgi:flavin-dependent dehydrogenase